MPISFKNLKHNYLLLGAVFSYCTFLFFSLIIYSFKEVFENSSRADIQTESFFLFVFSALVIGPIFEELSFRGYFSLSKKAKILMLLCFPVFSFSIEFNILVFFALAYYVLLLFDFFSSKKLNKAILYFGSALIFSIIHYQTKDFKSFLTVLPMFTQLGLGLVLTWVVVNINLKTSITIHFIYNFLIILPFFFSLQYPDEEINTTSVDGFEITWNKVPLISGEYAKITKPNSHSISGTNINPIKIYKSCYPIDNDKFILIDKESFYKYNIEISRSLETTKKLDEVILKKLLIKSNLIKEVKSK